MSYYFIDALRNETVENGYWRYFANSKDGEAASLSYSFMGSLEPGTTTYYGNPQVGFERYSTVEKAFIRDALRHFESYINVHFTEASTFSADINFGQFDINGYAGYAFHPIYEKSSGSIATGPNLGDVFLDTKEGFDAYTVLHEIAHALGLKHSFEGNHVLPKAQENSDYTVMSYTSGAANVLTLRLYDVIALQSIYGPAKQRLGNDVYQFGKDKLIWDGGGKDTITAASATKAVTINLNDGSWNYAGKKAGHVYADGQVFLGHFTTIENLKGSKFADTLTGNEEANLLVGGGGNDKITGASGADRCYGGIGNDTFIFARLADSSAKANDIVYDFQSGDKIDLHLIDASSTASGNNSFKFISSQQFHGVAGELRFMKENSDTWIYGDVNGDKTADMTIRLDDAFSLKAAHFVM